MVFSGVARKVTAGLVVLSAVGWVILVAGTFGQLSNGKTYVPAGDFSGNITEEHISIADPNNYPWWVVTVGGPLLFVVALLRAGYEGGNFAVGMLISVTTALLSVAYFSALGLILTLTGSKVHYGVAYWWIVLQFVGGLVAGVGWSLIMALWPFYSNQPQQYHVKSVVIKTLSVVFIGASASGWVVYTVSVGLSMDESGFFYFAEGYTAFAVILEGPWLFALATVHVLLGGKETGQLASTAAGFISVVYLTAIGSALHGYGIFIYNCQEDEYMALGYDCDDVPRHMVVGFVGSLISCIGWAATLVMWPFHIKPVTTTAQEEYQSLNNLDEPVATTTAQEEYQSLNNMDGPVLPAATTITQEEYQSLNNLDQLVSPVP